MIDQDGQDRVFQVHLTDRSFRGTSGTSGVDCSLMAWFFKERRPRGYRRLEDCIWYSQDASDAGLLREHDDRKKKGCRCVIAYFFDGTLERLRSLPGFPKDADLWKPDGGQRPAGRATGPPGESPALILFAERYPLQEVEERALEEVERAFPGMPEVVFYCSLDDAFMKAFASERARKLLVRLGMKEDEMLSSPGITRSIGRAQRKLARKVFMEWKASSAEEWFEKNLPGRLPRRP